jgi:photosystem II stability/assembly factor-like uncharacterized protein
MSSPGIITIDTEPLIIRTNGNGANNNTYVVKTYDYPISSNYILFTSSMGELYLSDSITISSITTSSITTQITNTITYRASTISTNVMLADNAIPSTLSTSLLNTTEVFASSSVGDLILIPSANIYSTTVTEFTFSTLLSNHFEYTSISTPALTISTLDRLNLSGNHLDIPLLIAPIINTPFESFETISCTLGSITRSFTSTILSQSFYPSTTKGISLDMDLCGVQQVGLSTISTAYLLNVVGDIRFTGNIYQNDRSYLPNVIDPNPWFASSFSLTYTAGKVGVGTSTIAYPFSVLGRTRMSIPSQSSINSTLAGYSTALLVYSTSLAQYNSSVTGYNQEEIAYTNAYQSTTIGYNNSLVTYSTLQAQYVIDYNSTVIGADLQETQYNAAYSAYENAYQSTVTGESTAVGLYEEAYAIWEAESASDYGLNWSVTTVDIGTSFAGIGLSGDGQYQTLSNPSSTDVDSALIYSNDAGETWNTATAPTDQNFNKVVIDTSGQYQGCIVSTTGGLYGSVDYGVTWSAYPDTPTGNVRDCAVGLSAVIYLCYYRGMIYRTEPMATSGIVGPLIPDQNGVIDSFMGICCSQQAEDIGYACATNTDGGSGTIYVIDTTDAWVALPNAPKNTAFFGICCDFSGQYVYATTSAGVIWYSADYGDTWTTANAPSLTWTYISCDATGQFLMVSSGSNGYIYYSSDYGVNWILSDSLPSTPWGAISLSQDGYVAAVIDQESVDVYESYTTVLYPPGPEPVPPPEPTYPNEPDPPSEVVYPDAPVAPDPPEYPAEPTPPSSTPPLMHPYKWLEHLMPLPKTLIFLIP